MVTKIFKYKKLLTIISIIIVLFLAIFLPVFFLVIKKQSSSELNLQPQSCSNLMATFPDQTSNLIKNNTIEIEITNALQTKYGMIINIINNTTTQKPCYVSWFNTEDNSNTPHNNKQHNIKTININNNKIIITFEETTLNDINPFPLHIHTFYNCINSCDYLKTIYPPL